MTEAALPCTTPISYRVSGPPCTMVNLLWVPFLMGSGKDFAAVPGAPVAHWAMNMQCLSPNTQVRRRQQLLEQQPPGGRCVQCSLGVCSRPGIC